MEGRTREPVVYGASESDQHSLAANTAGTREPVVDGASESDQHSLAATHDRHKIVWSFGRLQESREFWATSGKQRVLGDFGNPKANGVIGRGWEQRRRTVAMSI